MFRHFIRYKYSWLTIFLAAIAPIQGVCRSAEIVDEKRTMVVMRMIGHEVLTCLGDDHSRVLPIRYKDGRYKIPFEAEFAFDPDEIVSIIEKVMAESEEAIHYLVEVEQCTTKEVVHSFEIGNRGNHHLIPCKGRALPKDCYNLLITILNQEGILVHRSVMYPKGIDESNGSSSLSAYLLVPGLIVIGFIGYVIRKKNLEEDPNIVRVGASKFDKANLALSFNKNTILLSNKEAELLSLLHSAANKAVTREVILQRVWGDGGDYIGRTLDVFISKLRKKLEADESVRIMNIRGVGYKLVMDRSS